MGEQTKETDYYNRILESMQKNNLIANKRIESCRRLSVQRTQRNRCENTKLLLKAYRDIRWAVVMHLASISDISQYRAIERMDIGTVCRVLDKEIALLSEEEELEENDLRQKNEIRALKRSADLLKLVEDSIELIKLKGSEGKECAKILRIHYIDGNARHGKDLYRVMNMSGATYYRRLQEAINLLSVLIWGVPSGKVSALLDIAMAVSDYGGKGAGIEKNA